MSAQDCALILLASGLSQRFGRGNKLLADLHGKPLIQYAIDAALPFGFARNIAVISHDDALKVLLETAGFECVINPDPARGHQSSRSLGLNRAVNHGQDAALIILGDMPFITREHIKLILETGRTHDAVFSSNKDATLPPAFFKGETLSLMALNIKPASFAAVPLSERDARDIDTKADLAQAARLF